MSPIVSGGGGGGGSQPSTTTATVTTDANTFVVDRVIDTGHVTLAFSKMTILAQTPDGETFGAGGTDLSVSQLAATSRDGVNYTTLGNISTIATAADVFGVGNFSQGILQSARYLKIRVTIVDNATGDTYAGANHPTAQARLDVEYL